MQYPFLGATVEPGGVRFRVVSPVAQRMEIVVEDGSGQSKLYSMSRREGGLFEAFIDGLQAGARYRYRMDGGDTLYPDPASRFQPKGVHGPSEVIDPNAYRWQDAGWTGVPQRELVFYELHVGTFTPEGTFEAARAKLPYLRELGVTAVELLPVAAFPGERNWGYDPAAQFAPAHPYGRPDDLRRFVDDAHRLGLAVYLDVVYNHFGPDGAYVVGLNPQMFTDHHHTPWGQAINLDDEGSAAVRAFFLENAVYWLREFHVDGFRLDATFALVDDSPKHFLAELAEVVADVPGWRRLLIAEDPRNMRQLVEPRDRGGYGLDGIWADDFHHLVRRHLAGDHHAYYGDFSGKVQDIALTLKQGWFYTGQHAASWNGPRGTPTDGLKPEHFVFCLQNHDQVGNRPQGNRLSDDISLDAYRAASALLLFAPQLPLLFQGQEWATKTPFLYFTDHHPELGKLVSEGRKEEFKGFPAFQGDVPDPQDERSFLRSKLDWGELGKEAHAGMLALYRDLLALRRELSGDIDVVHVTDEGLVARRGPFTLLLAFQGGTTLPLTEAAVVRLVTESARYARGGCEPTFEAGSVRFPTPGAVIAEVRA
jgi:maltooligosyltrehalose trehalohydrolase